MKITSEIKERLKARKFKCNILDRVNRESCLQLIIDNPKGLNAGTIERLLKLDQTTTSQALADLRRNDLVETIRDGKFINYYPIMPNIKKFFGIEDAPDTKELIQVHAIANFWLACHNMSNRGLIEKVFADESESTINHLNNLFRDSGYLINNFIKLIDEEKRGKLICHIINNYQGVDITQIKKYYLKK